MNVYERAQNCIARLAENGGQGRTGTAFFVAPGYLLTCAHVVEERTGNPQSYTVETKAGTFQSRPEQIRPMDGNDLALVKVPIFDHPCVLFGAAAEPTDAVWTQGYINQQGEIRFEPVTGEIEGERRTRLEAGGQEYTLIKFKGGQVIAGMSGSPLLNMRSTAVCGIVAKTRNEANDAGGLAIPVRTILYCYPFLADMQSSYHRRSPSWRVDGVIEPNSQMTQEDKVHAVGAYPAGPAVLIAIVPIDIITAFYGLSIPDSVSTVIEANNIRVAIEPKLKPRLITLIGLPSVGDVGLVNYWLATFTQAAARGPRMLAAVLYAAPPNTFVGVEREVVELLATLRTWPIQ